MGRMITNITLPMAAIARFCKQHHIRQMALFGSVLRADFDPDSDIDVLVTFASGHEPTLLKFVAMQDELAQLLGREIDLLELDSVLEDPNYLRREAILTTAQVVYEA